MISFCLVIISKSVSSNAAFSSQNHLPEAKRLAANELKQQQAADRHQKAAEKAAAKLAKGKGPRDAFVPTIVDQTALDEAVDSICFTSQTYPPIVKWAQQYIDSSTTFYANTESSKRPSNFGKYNDVWLCTPAGSVPTLIDSSVLLKAIQIERKRHRPDNSMVNKLLLFEKGDMIGGHADSATTTYQTTRETVQRIVFYCAMDNDPETVLSDFIVRNSGDIGEQADFVGGPGSVSKVVKRKHLTATSMTSTAARFGRTAKGPHLASDQQIYHRTTEAPARTLGWAGDVNCTPKVFWDAVEAQIKILLEDKKFVACAAVEACPLAVRSAPTERDGKFNRKSILDKKFNKPPERPKKRQKKKE